MTTTDAKEFNRLADELDAYAQKYSGDWAKACLTVTWCDMKAIVTALRTTAAASSAGAVKVKPLEWRRIGDCWKADRYSIRMDHGVPVYYVVRGWDSGTNPYDTLDAAKAAAQADYESRILAALIPEPAKAGDAVLLRELWQSINGGPTPSCRDCAAVDGRCHVDNLPCDPQERALEQIKRLREALVHAQQCIARETTRCIVLETTIRDAIEALERNSTSAPVVECLKAALASTAQPDTAAQGGKQSDGGGERFVDSAYQIAEEMRREDRSSEPAPAEPVARARLVPLKNLLALSALLPPKPVVTDDGTFAYQDPNAAERLNELRSVFDALIVASPLYAHPIAPAAPVSVDEVAAFIEPAAFYGNADDRHRYCSPLRVEVVQERVRERARAFLDAFKMERK